MPSTRRPVLLLACAALTAVPVTLGQLPAEAGAGGQAAGAGGQAAGAGGAAARVGARVGAVSVADLPPVVYSAHRCGSMEARENSLSGCRATLESGTAQVLDLDTRELRNGRLVLMHDPTVDRTTSSTGEVADFSPTAWSRVRLDIGDWLRPRPTDEPAPTLTQALDELGGQAVLTVEAKNPDSVDRIAQLLRVRGLQDSVLINTNRPGTAEYVHSLGLHSHLWRTARQMRGDDPRAFASYVDVLDADIDATDEDLARFTTSGAPRVWVHTLTTRGERDRALRLGATGFVTDDPRYLTGQTDIYPMPPTAVRVVTPPRRTQVSDPVTTRVAVETVSGPPIPEPVLGVRGRGITAETVAVGAGSVRTLRLDTTGALAGGGPVTYRVRAGAEGERRWTSGSLGMPLPLVREDLQLRSGLDRHGRRLRFRVRLLDSAADRYRGPGKESGADATVADLTRSTVTVTVRARGRVVHRETVGGPSTGVRDGDATLAIRWTAPRAGRYVVTFTQRGPVHRTVSTQRRFRVR